MNEEWGPWIAHDGSGCPLRPGQFVHVQYTFMEYVGPVLAGMETDQSGWAVTGLLQSGDGYACSWTWSQPGRCQPVRRYRIRKPRALTQLREQIAEIDVPEVVPA